MPRAPRCTNNPKIFTVNQNSRSFQTITKKIKKKSLEKTAGNWYKNKFGLKKIDRVHQKIASIDRERRPPEKYTKHMARLALGSYRHNAEWAAEFPAMATNTITIDGTPETMGLTC
jgi:hypothetical protein